jgi:hypothetical protein
MYLQVEEEGKRVSVRVMQDYQPLLVLKMDGSHESNTSGSWEKKQEIDSILEPQERIQSR